MFKVAVSFDLIVKDMMINMKSISMRSMYHDGRKCTILSKSVI
jgi:hypothetical protein